MAFVSVSSTRRMAEVADAKVRFIATEPLVKMLVWGLRKMGGRGYERAIDVVDEALGGVIADEVVEVIEE
jgi:hypothetical protein